MENRYKIIISNRQLYKEVEISSEEKFVKIGTDVNCDVRLRRSLFFSPIELTAANVNGQWSITCSEDIYLTEDNIAKLITRQLNHGDTLIVKYRESDNEAFSLSFMIDFDYKSRKYERCIETKNADYISIGTEDSCNIVLYGSYVTKEKVVLKRRNEKLVLDVISTKYGVNINGKKCGKSAEIKDKDFISIGDFSFYYSDGYLWTESDDRIVINNLTYVDRKNKNNYPKFKRNTRVKTVESNEKIEILDPPSKPQKPRSDILTRLLPSIVMIAASIIIGVVMGGMMIVFSIVSGIMGIVTAIMTLVQNKKEFKEKTQERIEKYNNYIENKRKEIAEIREEEKNTLEDIYISENVTIDNYRNFSPELFDRVPSDDDFLKVRLGAGSLEAKRQVNYKKQERLEIEDELQELPKKVYEEFKYIYNAPVVCDFNASNAIGIVGNGEYRFEIMKNIVIDICARQYYTDVNMFFVMDKYNKDKAHWLRMLPYVKNDITGLRNIAYDDESKSAVFEYLYKEFSIRAQKKSYDSNMVIFFYDDCGFNAHPISKFVNKATELGATFVFFGDTKADIHLGCDYIIDVKSEKKAMLINTQDNRECSEFEYPEISDEQAEKIVNILAPVYTEELSLEGALAKNISLFELLNIIAVDDINLEKNWADSKVFNSMSAPIGISKSDIVSLDLHDKAHGPHGLVAGTTGSGKSEILQTYILSMAVLFHPYEIGFVIIDFKGGGMANQFKHLPHLMGTITNIDGKEIERSLKSIKAELQKRQRFFADADVNHIDKYIKKYKAGEVANPLPHLIIIVDEFAELKAEQPEFMKELISAARIGRSLGVHLILATQKPSGQVNEQIWSNSRFKLCLKVQSQEDSNEVLKSPLAAEIKEPGRAYLQVGNNEIFELFQSAYSGASEKIDDSNEKEFKIYAVEDSGRKTTVFEQRKKRTEENGKTQLEAIVDYIYEYSESTGLQKLPDICLPGLPEILEFKAKKSSENIGCCIGEYDYPEEQYQSDVEINFSKENVLIIGGSQTGKTNILQTIIKGLTSVFTVDAVNLYVIDFDSMILKNYENLNHIGGVACVNDAEKLKNMMKLISNEMNTRKKILLKTGVSSYSSYLEAGYAEMPQIVILVDNISLFRELYEKEAEQLMFVCKEGLSVGISVVATNNQTLGIGYRLISNFNYKVALSCNDASDYSSLFGIPKANLENKQGRFITEIDKAVVECQAYLAFEGEKEYQRIESIKKFVTQTNQNNAGKKAMMVPVIPELLTFKYVYDINEPQKPYNWALGINYENIRPVNIDLSRIVALGIVGDGESCDSILKGMFLSFDRYEEKKKIYIADDMSCILNKYRNDEKDIYYTNIGERYTELIHTIYEEVRVRYNKAVAESDSYLDEVPLIILVAHGMEFVDAISSDSKAQGEFNQIITKYKGMKVCVVLSGIENNRIPLMGAEVLRYVKDKGNFIIKGELSDIRVIDVDPILSRNLREGVNEEDVFFFEDKNIVRVKLPS